MLNANTQSPTKAGWVWAGEVEQVAIGQGRCLLIRGRKIALFRMRDGKVYALDGVCPHRGGPLAEGIAGRETVICPLHGYKFSLIDGRGLDSKLTAGSYPAEVREGNLYVRLPL